jgi:probable rRNA maturation factor
MKRAAAAALTIDVIVDSEQWKDAGAAKAVVRRAVTQAAVALSTNPTELAIVLTDDRKMRALNRNWRGTDAATDVLSFATKNAGGRHLGDIVLAYETVVREAHREHKPLAHHLAHLAVHGFLHLLGFDHESDEEAREMEHAERAVLRQLAIPDPYRSRAPARPEHAKPATKQGARSRAHTARSA